MSLRYYHYNRHHQSWLQSAASLIIHCGVDTSTHFSLIQPLLWLSFTHSLTHSHTHSLTHSLSVAVSYHWNTPRFKRPRHANGLELFETNFDLIIVIVESCRWVGQSVGLSPPSVRHHPRSWIHDLYIYNAKGRLPVAAGFWIAQFLRFLRFDSQLSPTGGPGPFGPLWIEGIGASGIE